MKENLDKINDLFKKQIEIQEEINLLMKPIEEDLYFSVIELTNNISNVEHIINGVSFYLDGEERISFHISYYNTRYALNITSSLSEIFSFETKEQLFEKFFSILKEKFPQQLRELKLIRIIEESK